MSNEAPQTFTIHFATLAEIEECFGSWDVQDVDYSGRRVYETTHYTDDGRPYFARAVMHRCSVGIHYAAMECTDFPPH